jgi:hypothetical protein
MAAAYQPVQWAVAQEHSGMYMATWPDCQALQLCSLCQDQLQLPHHPLVIQQLLAEVPTHFRTVTEQHHSTTAAACHSTTCT